MFKRKARILFLTSDNSCAARIATAYAKQLGAKYIEVKSASISTEIVDHVTPQFNTELLMWCDTVITLTTHAEEHCPTLPVGRQRTHWSLPEASKSMATMEKLSDASKNDIKSRVEGLIGGLKMLDRSA